MCAAAWEIERRVLLSIHDPTCALARAIGLNFKVRTDRSSLRFFRQVIVELRALRTAISSRRSMAALARSTAAHVPDSATCCV
jgi:hypothetical protein